MNENHNATVAYDAKVTGGARVYRSAPATGSATVTYDAKVTGGAAAHNTAQVFGRALVTLATAWRR